MDLKFYIPFLLKVYTKDIIGLTTTIIKFVS